MPRTAEAHLQRASRTAATIGSVLFLLWVTGSISTIQLLDVGLTSFAGSRFVLFGAAICVIVGVIIGYGVVLFQPFVRAHRRANAIDALLPETTSFMYALTSGGMHELDVIRSVAESHDAYGEIAAEFQWLLRDAVMTQGNYRSAIARRANTTPSDDFREFLTDFLGIIESGGDLISFLDDRAKTQLDRAKENDERLLDTLELFGELYLTVSLFPLLLIIILVVVNMLGESSLTMLLLTVYVLLPLLGLGFLVLLSMVTEDQIATIEHQHPVGQIRDTPRHRAVKRIRRWQRITVRYQQLRHPLRSLRESPPLTLCLSLPLLASVYVAMLYAGLLPVSYAQISASPIWSTAVWGYLPILTLLTPLAVFSEWKYRSRHAIVPILPSLLRKLGTANASGQTVIDSFASVAQTTPPHVSSELTEIGGKVKTGIAFRDALDDLTQTYRIPRLARTVNLIDKAQYASNDVAGVLIIGSQAAKNQAMKERNRVNRTRMQVAIIIMTYLTMVAVIAILNIQFLDVLADLKSTGQRNESFGAEIDVELMGVLFFHTITIQAIFAGLCCGYLRDARLQSGMKFVIPLLVLALAVWLVIG